MQSLFGFYKLKYNKCYVTTQKYNIVFKCLRAFLYRPFIYFQGIYATLMLIMNVSPCHFIIKLLRTSIHFFLKPMADTKVYQKTLKFYNNPYFPSAQEGARICSNSNIAIFHYIPLDLYISQFDSTQFFVLYCQ